MRREGGGRGVRGGVQGGRDVLCFGSDEHDDAAALLLIIAWPLLLQIYPMISQFLVLFLLMVDDEADNLVKYSVDFIP